MLDLKLIRENLSVVQEALANRHDTAPLDEIVALDTDRRRSVLELEDLRRIRKEIARDRQAEAAEKGRALRGQIRDLEVAVRDIEQKLQDLLLQVPNIPQLLFAAVFVNRLRDRGHTDAERLNGDRRRVSHYFHQISAMLDCGAVDTDFIKKLIKKDQVDTLLDIAKGLLKSEAAELLRSGQ